MNEITRIHIAKVPYDIETAAKKEITDYIKLLEKYADDQDIFNDIEIRITEILAERKVGPNGVITNDDVKAIRNQLGEPKDFKGENELLIDNEIEPENSELIRKLYRDKDNAIVGGVLSGIANYFRIDPVWVRLLFVILFFVTSGGFLFVYIVMWIVVPPARTTAEKLQMSGRPVTLGSIRQLNEIEPKMVADYERASSARRVISIIAGICMLIMSVCTLMFTIFAALGIGKYTPFNEINFSMGWEIVTAYILAIIAGVLLSIMFGVFAYAAFVRKFTNRIAAALAVVIVCGLVSFGTAVGLCAFSAGDEIQRNQSQTTLQIPSGFGNIKSLTVDSKLMSIDYIVDNNPRIIMHSLVGDNEPSISVDGTIANLSYDEKLTDRWPRYNPTLTIYGPKLESLKVENGELIYKTDIQNMTVEAIGQESTVELSGGKFEKLVLNLSDQSSVSADYATVEDVTINQNEGSNIILGSVKSLSITHPEACSVGEKATTNVRGVSSDSIIYNNSSVAAETHESQCGLVTVGDNE